MKMTSCAVNIHSKAHALAIAHPYFVRTTLIKSGYSYRVQLGKASRRHKFDQQWHLFKGVSLLEIHVKILHSKLPFHVAYQMKVCD